MMSAACADTPSFGSLNAPLSPTLRASVVGVLKKLGEPHPDRIAESASTFRFLNCSSGSYCFVRIEHPGYCEDDRCLTMIMPGVANASKPLAMFYAGRSGGMAEPEEGLVGLSLCFWTKTSTVCVSETPMGFIVH